MCPFPFFVISKTAKITLIGKLVSMEFASSSTRNAVRSAPQLTCQKLPLNKVSQISWFEGVPLNTLFQVGITSRRLTLSFAKAASKVQSQRKRVSLSVLRAIKVKRWPSAIKSTRTSGGAAALNDKRWLAARQTSCHPWRTFSLGHRGARRETVPVSHHMHNPNLILELAVTWRNCQTSIVWPSYYHVWHKSTWIFLQVNRYTNWLLCQLH